MHAQQLDGISEQRMIGIVEQVLEATGVAVMMQGGPAFTHVPEVLAALEHLEGKAGT